MVVKKELLANIKCWLFDLDGTIYLGDKLINGASEIIEVMGHQQIPFYFLTNNSSRSREDYVQKLAGLGLDIPKEKIFSSGQAAALYLQKINPNAEIFLVGTHSLEEEFIQHGFQLTDENPDYVVLGFDTTLTYKKLEKLCQFVVEGKPYIATHPDINCPTETGFIPDVGSFIALVAASTGRTPDTIIGKPHTPIIETIVEKTAYRPEEIAMVGDRLYTDIALGEAGIATVLVLSGETKKEDVKDSPFKPDLIVQDVFELLKILK